MQFTKHIYDVAGLVGGAVASVVNELVPPTCLTCDRTVIRQGGCCAECWNELHFIHAPICPVMGTPFPVDMGEEVQSLEAISEPPPFEHLRAAVLYGKRARQLVTQLKFSDRTDLAPWMARWMEVAGKELLETSDVVVPVPLHFYRLLGRRYNQSAELARNICRNDRNKGPVFCPDVLTRRRKTEQQTGLTESQRQRNVAGAFVVPDEQLITIQGKRVLLVDDVYTTGATAKAATRALLRAKAECVKVLVFAKVEIEQG